MRYINLGVQAGTIGRPSEIIVPENDVILKDHRFLLSFLNADFSFLEQQIRNYIKNTEKGVDYDVPDAVYNGLSTLHPWFSENPANASALLNRIFAAYVTDRYADPKTRTSLMEALFASRGIGGCNAAFWLNEDPERYQQEWDGPLLSVPLVLVQRRLKEMAVFLIDSTTAAFSGLSPYKRIALYGFVCGGENSFGALDGFVRAARIEHAYGHVQGAIERSISAKAEFPGSNDLLSNEAVAADASAVVDDPAAKAPVLKEIASGLDKKRRAATDEILIPSSLFDLLSFEIWEMFKKGVGAQRLPSGEFIVPGKDDSAPVHDRDLKSELKATYTKAYKTHHARIRYGMMTQEQLSEWSKKAKEMMEKAMNGEISASEFSSFLKK